MTVFPTVYSKICPHTRTFPLQPTQETLTFSKACLTSVTDGKCGELAGAPVEVPAAVDERADESRLQDRLVEGGVVAAQVAHHVAGTCPYFALCMLQQWPQVLRDPGLYGNLRC